MNPPSEALVSRQLDAYNARDLDAFVAQYAENVRVFRPPGLEPAIVGRRAMAEYYARHRFSLPGLHAEVLNRMVLGNKVVDHERIHGVRAAPFETVAVYEIVDGLISVVWFFSAE